MKRKNWFWGLLFLAAAVCIIAFQAGAFVSLGFWSIAAAVVLAALCIDSLIDRNFFGVFIPLGLLYLIFEKPFELPVVTFWPLMFAAVLASIGLSILVHGRRHGRKWEKEWKEHWGGHGRETEEKVDGNDVCVKTSFDQSCKYLHADSLEKAYLSVSFGKMSVYFDQVQLSPKGAEVFAEVSFGLMALYLPKGWRVEDHTEAGMGAVKYEGHAAPAENAPVLTLGGRASFGNLEIHYI